MLPFICTLWLRWHYIENRPEKDAAIILSDSLISEMVTVASSLCLRVYKQLYPQPGWIHKFQDKSSHRVFDRRLIKLQFMCGPGVAGHFDLQVQCFTIELANKINDGALLLRPKDNTRHGVLTENWNVFLARKILTFQYDGSFSGFYLSGQP